MTMRKVAQRIPFTPSRTQAALLERCFGDRRFAYNQQVEAFNTYDKETNPKPEYPNVTGMKSANGWLKDSPIPSNALSNAIMDFRKAQSAYFRKAQYEKHRPRFRLKERQHPIVPQYHADTPYERQPVPVVQEAWLGAHPQTRPVAPSDREPVQLDGET